MTATLPPVQTTSVQPASSASPAAGSAAPEVPFSQVLSGEIAQQRGRPADTPDSDSHADGDEATPADAASATPAASLPPDWLPGAVAAAADSASPATVSTAPTADTLLAIAQNPDLLKPDSPAAADAAGEPASAPRNPSPFSADSAARSAVRAAWADARSGQSNAATHAADAARDTVARNVATDAASDSVARNAAADAAALTARAETVRSVERLPDFMAALNHAQTTQAASIAAAPLQTSDRLSPPLGSAAWNQALGDKIVWMAAGSQQSATLTLNPPDLGPLQVVLNVSNEQASAQFFAAQPEVRQALEAALPRLREMMLDAGIQLGQANVSADTARQQDNSPRDTPRNSPGFLDADADVVAEASLAALPVRAGRGLVDTFA